MKRLICRLIGHDWFDIRSWDPRNRPAYFCRQCGDNRGWRNQ